MKLRHCEEHSDVAIRDINTPVVPLGYLDCKQNFENNEKK